MSNNVKFRGVRAFLALLLVFSFLFSLTGCLFFNEQPKDKIEANILAAEGGEGQKHSYVSSYLAEWGLPRFDAAKLQWVERVFYTYYNLDGGMPDTLEHAALTARNFLNNYYDEIDKNDSGEVTDSIISCYVEAVGDPYAVYRVPEAFEDFEVDMSGSFGGIGVVVEINHINASVMVTSVLIDSPAEKAGFRVGDLIVGVDGESAEDIGYQSVVYKIRGEIGTSVTVTVNRDGELINLVATRAQVEEKTVDYKITDEGYGYIQVTDFKSNTDEQFIAAVDYLEAEGVNGFIFDMRNNLGGYLDTVCNMVSYLIPSGNTIVTYQYKNKTMRGRVSGTDTTSEGVKADHVVDAPMVVLCNEYTASAAEIFTAALRDYRDTGLLEARTIGAVTFKKGVMQNSYPYRDGSTLTLTIAYYNPPSGVNYHGIGITPDVLVENTESRDMQLERAISELEILVNAN